MIEIKNLSKTFETKDTQVSALHDIAITINDGDIYGIIGMSGAGKSTLVRCINMLERPTSGTVCIDGSDIGVLSEKDLRSVRRKIAMVFQHFNLLMQKTCLQNICFPLRLEGKSKSEAEKRGRELLEIVGLPDKAGAYPAQLSGGQKQRIAIARALATDPTVLLCDEATSALDPKTTNQILDLISEINRRTGITVVVITHQMSVVEKICNRVAILDHGRVAEEGKVSDIFADPKSEAAKRLVFPDRGEQGLAAVKEGYKIISVSFNDAEATDSPLIANLAVEKDVHASIVYAATRSVGGRMYGKMLLRIPDDETKIKDTREFFSSVPGIIANVEDEETLRKAAE